MQSSLIDTSTFEKLPLVDFLNDFGSDLFRAVREQNPPVYNGPDPKRAVILDGLMRKLFDAQADRVQAAAKLLLDNNEPAVIFNADMGTGKSIMGTALATLLHHEGFHRTLVLSPPHLVYKWRREIKKTVPNAKVWILNGPDTLRKLIELRMVGLKTPEHPEFFILGRVRMRMGFNWVPVFLLRKFYDVHRSRETDKKYVNVKNFAACPSCAELIRDDDENPINEWQAQEVLSKSRCSCKKCGDRLWTLIRGDKNAANLRNTVSKALQQMPTIGEKTAEKLLNKFGEDMLSNMLSDNVYEFINIMDEDGELVFSDSQARRMERYLANSEISFGQGGYQPTEFIKRYLPQNFFGLCLVDEGHEYKNEGSAQGQAMGVLARKCNKVALLTGTLMGGYADDLFYLLFRIKPQMMIEDGFGYNSKNSLSTGSSAFMREHGVLIDILKETEEKSHKTSKGSQVTRSVKKGPGFSPQGIMRYILPYTVFMRLNEVGAYLPPYKEYFEPTLMSAKQRSTYDDMERELLKLLKEALVKKDNTLLGVVLNTLLAWPDCAFRDEIVKHPRTRKTLLHIPKVFDEAELSPKEMQLRDYCLNSKSLGRRVLVYAIYTGTRDTTGRLKEQLSRVGLKVAVLKATVPAEQREDWVAEQLERGVDVLICNPELVKTGLDLLEFPDIYFMQTGYNVYTVMQAARRSWRIGQENDVNVTYAGYENSAQQRCLELMSKKIAVTQSTSGEMPESGLDVLNQGGESMEVQMAKELLEKAALLY